jgi:hypothetical protein
VLSSLVASELTIFLDLGTDFNNMPTNTAEVRTFDVDGTPAASLQGDRINIRKQTKKFTRKYHCLMIQTSTAKEIRSTPNDFAASITVEMFMFIIHIDGKVTRICLNKLFNI